MLFFIIQTLLLLAIAYIVGCVLGCWLHRIFGAANEPAAIAPVAAAAAVAPMAAAPVVAAVAAPKPAPVAAAEPETVATPEPAALVAAPAAAAVAASTKDDLKRIRGIGRQNEARLNAMDVMTFAQIAAWTSADEATYGEKLAFPGRIEREEWVAQAKILAEGGITDFAKRVDRGEVETSTGKGTIGDMNNVGFRPKKK
jgi:predicted flap endonuclease-1-like 5' DNA nuclease